MNCPYCQQDCVQHNILGAGWGYHWVCSACNVSFRYSENSDLLRVTWKDIIVNGRQFVVKLYDGATGNAPEFVIDYYVVNDLGKHYWEEVLRFDFIPQGWTPQNIVEKLKTHLPYI